MFSFIRVWLNGWVNIHKAGDSKRYRAHYDAIVMSVIYLIIVDWNSNYNS